MKRYYSKTFIRKVKKYDLKLRKRIMEAIYKLPYEGDIKRLKGKKLKDIFRLRVGKYRIIFQIKEEKIYILDIDTRGDIY